MVTTTNEILEKVDGEVHKNVLNNPKDSKCFQVFSVTY